MRSSDVLPFFPISLSEQTFRVYMADMIPEGGKIKTKSKRIFAAGLLRGFVSCVFF